jgi:hypothetical protein
MCQHTLTAAVYVSMSPPRHPALTLTILLYYLLYYSDRPLCVGEVQR